MILYAAARRRRRSSSDQGAATAVIVNLARWFTVHLLAGNGRYWLLRVGQQAARLGIPAQPVTELVARVTNLHSGNPGQRLAIWFGRCYYHPHGSPHKKKPISNY
jgi:hypothetical protein